MPDLTISLPTLTERQIDAHRRFREVKTALLERPRRWGKTTLAQTISVDAVVKGKRVGWFDGSFGAISDTFDEIAAMLEPIATSTSKNRGVICTHMPRGRVEFYDSASPLAGHGRAFDVVIVDNTTHCTDAIMCSMYGALVLVTACDDPMCRAGRETEFGFLARI